MMFVIIGVLCGMITGLGMGGGSFLILFLTAFMHIEQHLSQATNLIFYIPTSIATLMVYFKNKKIDSIIGQKLLYSTILGATIGAFLTKRIHTAQLRKCFAIFVFMVGVFDLIKSIRLPKKKGSKNLR